MCDVQLALMRAVLIQLVFLLKDWDDYQRLVRIIAKI